MLFGIVMFCEVFATKLRDMGVGNWTFQFGVNLQKKKKNEKIVPSPDMYPKFTTLDNIGMIVLVLNETFFSLGKQISFSLQF